MSSLSASLQRSSLGIGCSLNLVHGACLHASFTAHVEPFASLDSTSWPQHPTDQAHILLVYPFCRCRVTRCGDHFYFNPRCTVGARRLVGAPDARLVGYSYGLQRPLSTFKATRLGIRAFALIIIVLAAISALAVMTSPAIAIVGLMSSYLAFGIVEGIWRLTQPEDELEDEDDYELIGFT